MTAFADRERDDDATWQHDRVSALTVPCEDCHAPVGGECRNLLTGRPLEHQAAHAKRIEAGRVS